jgi:hypothetical protein
MTVNKMSPVLISKCVCLVTRPERKTINLKDIIKQSRNEKCPFLVVVCMRISRLCGAIRVALALSLSV